MTDKITIERETLNPCPFCGAEAEILTIPEDHPDAGAMFVQCCDSRCMTSSALLYPLMDDVRALLVERWNRRAALAAQRAEPVAWLHICVKPGRREVYATVDPDDNKWWPADQWTSHTVHPLYAAPPAPAAVPLTDEKIDHTLATTLDEFARTTRGMSHALDVNADITANSRLRRMFARAVLAAAGDKP